MSWKYQLAIYQKKGAVEFDEKRKSIRLYEVSISEIPYTSEQKDTRAIKIL